MGALRQSDSCDSRALKTGFSDWLTRSAVRYLDAFPRSSGDPIIPRRTHAGSLEALRVTRPEAVDLEGINPRAISLLAAAQTVRRSSPKAFVITLVVTSLLSLTLKTRKLSTFLSGWERSQSFRHVSIFR